MPAAYYDLYGEEGAFFVLKLNLLDKDGKPVNLSDSTKGFYVPEELQALGIQSSEIQSINGRLQLKSNIFNEDSIILFKSDGPTTSEGSIILKDSLNNKTLDHNILIHKKLTRTTLILGQLEGMELVEPGIGLVPQNLIVTDVKGTTYRITTSKLGNPDTEATYHSADKPYPRTRLYTTGGNFGVCDYTLSNVTINKVNTKASYSEGEILDLNVGAGGFPCVYYTYGASEGIGTEDPIETENLIYYLSVTSLYGAATPQVPNQGDIIPFTGVINGQTVTLPFTVAVRYGGTPREGRWDAVFGLWYGGDTSTGDFKSYTKLQQFFSTVSRTNNITFTRQNWNDGTPKGSIPAGAGTGVIQALGGAHAVYCGDKSQWKNPPNADVFNTAAQKSLTLNNFQIDPRVITDIGGNPSSGPSGSAEKRLYFLSCSKQQKYLNQWDGWADGFAQCGCLMKIYAGADNTAIETMNTRIVDEVATSVLPDAIYDLKSGTTGGVPSGKFMNGVEVQDGRDLMRYVTPKIKVTSVSQKDVSILGTHFYDLELDFVVTGANAGTYTIRMMQGKFTISPEVSF